MNAAETQAEALGLPDVRRVVVPHPIQDATDEDIPTTAAVIVDQVLETLVC